MHRFEKRLIVTGALIFMCIFVWFGLYLQDESSFSVKLKQGNIPLHPQTHCHHHRLYKVEDFLVRADETIDFYKRLPNLSELEWPRVEHQKLPISGKPLPAVFEPVMSKGQERVLRRLLDLFVKLMIANGMADKYMLYGASVIGSFRHHDIIPWDDDIDVLVDAELRPKVQAILAKLAPEFELKIDKDRDKFHTRINNNSKSENDIELSRRTSKYTWGWPYLDISYSRTNETHVYELGQSYGRAYSLPKSVIYPLTYRPFGPKWYPFPRDPLSYLHHTYTATSLCKITGYSHILETRGPWGKMRCETLGFRYPFVEHAPCGSKFEKQTDKSDEDDGNEIVWSKESLIIRTNITDRAVIHSICLPVPRHNLRSQTFGFNYRKET